MRASTTGTILSLFLMAAWTPALAQFSVEAGLETMIDDNVNNNALRLSDRISSLGLQTGYDWITDATSTGLFYNGGYNYFTMVPGRTNQTHTGGVTFAHVFGENEETLWNAAATYGTRLDREDYAFYDNTSFTLSSTLKHQLSESILGRVGYTLRFMRFSNLASFNYAEHQVFAQTSFFLPSQTTIIGQLDLGMKLYSTPNEDSTTAGQSRGRRSSALSSPGVTQMTGSVRVGQSLFQNTGLSVTAGYQINLRKEIRYLSSSYGLVADDEIFEDHYGYEGPQTSVMLTQILPWDMKLRVTGSWQRRTYAAQAAYDEAGIQVGAERLDTRRAFNVQWHIPVRALGFTVGLAYDRIWNASNDSFYAYTNNAFTLQLSYP